MGAQLVTALSINPEHALAGMKVSLTSSLAMAVVAACFLTWLWSLGSFLNARVQSSLRPRMRFFYFSLAYTPVAVFVFCILIEHFGPEVILVVFPLHLLAMACMVYLLYFVAKNLVLAERSRAGSFFEYVWVCILLWWFPIGIWFLQPRINRLYAQAPSPSSGALGSL